MDKEQENVLAFVPYTDDPREFLRLVMQATCLDMGLRIEAAKGLLLDRATAGNG